MDKCFQEKYCCQVVQFGTNIALYVKCSKMRLYISSRGHFKQLCLRTIKLSNYRCLRAVLGVNLVKVVAWELFEFLSGGNKGGGVGDTNQER